MCVCAYLVTYTVHNIHICLLKHSFANECVYYANILVYSFLAYRGVDVLHSAHLLAPSISAQ